MNLFFLCGGLRKVTFYKNVEENFGDKGHFYTAKNISFYKFKNFNGDNNPKIRTGDWTVVNFYF